MDSVTLLKGWRTIHSLLRFGVVLYYISVRFLVLASSSPFPLSELTCTPLILEDSGHGIRPIVGDHKHLMRAIRNFGKNTALATEVRVVEIGCNLNG